MSDDLYTGPSALEPAPKPRGLVARHLAQWVMLPLMLVLLAVILVFYVFFTSAVVDGESMMPTLRNSDYLLVTHGDAALQRGDVIVTKVLENTGPVELIKRVIALPGDTVEIRGDVAYVNGQQEPARGQFVVPQYSDNVGPYVVPAGYIYVMGDNRPISEDSRYLGPLPMSGLKGKAVFVFAPINRVRVIK
jgi:signal peptidase I